MLKIVNQDKLTNLKILLFNISINPLIIVCTEALKLENNVNMEKILSCSSVQKIFSFKMM